MAIPIFNLNIFIKHSRFRLKRSLYYTHTQSNSYMMNETPKKTQSLTYRDAGVDIEAGDRLVDDIKIISEATRRPEVLGSIGGFSALFELKRYKNPVLVSATDGVGT